MTTKERIEQLVDAKSDQTYKVLSNIWDYAELNFKETKSAKELANTLEKEGFAIEMGVSGMPTAFVATWSNTEAGAKSPTLGFLGEYDALPALSQEADNPIKTPITTVADPGHGCGHNLLGAGAMAAAIAMKEYCEQTGLKATVKYFGCPAEENGGGKVFMARDGLFDDLSAALTWHPSTSNDAQGVSSLAIITVMYHFKGKTAHAAGAPHLGRSALDAVELMNVGANYLREHIIPEARLHYAYIDAGGDAPNVVQDRSTIYYYIRAPKAQQVFEIFDRVNKIAEGAALMTGTTMTSNIIDGLTDYIPNYTLSSLLAESMQEIGAPVWTDEDKAYAQKFQETLDATEIKSGIERLAASNHVDPSIYEGKALDDNVPNYFHNPTYHSSGSTDVGDVSYCTPTAQARTATHALGTGGHTWQMVAQGKSSIAQKGTLFAAKAMALTAIKAAENPTLLEKAKEEYKKDCPDGYICMIPDDVKPYLV